MTGPATPGSATTAERARVGRPRVRPSILLLLGACLTSACWIEDCTGLDNCDPTKEDCSLSVTCCTPPVSTAPAPAALTLVCGRHVGVRDGDDFAEFDLNIRGGTSPYAYTAAFGDGESASGSRAGTAGEATRVILTHTYTRPGGPAPQTFTMNATITDQAGVRLMCAVNHPVNPPRLDLDCNVSPRNGVVPLLVTFDARPSGCVGPCVVSWDFGDGSPRSPGQYAEHVYTTSGSNIFYTHPARATVTDSTDRSYECLRTVEARPADDPGSNPTPTPTPSPGPTPTSTPTPTPTPTPPPNQPPVITGLTAIPSKIVIGALPASVHASVTDPNGDPVTWTLAVAPGSAGNGTFTPAAGSGGVVSSQFFGTAQGNVVLRLTASDGQASTQATVTVFVVSAE